MGTPVVVWHFSEKQDLRLLFNNFTTIVSSYSNKALPTDPSTFSIFMDQDVGVLVKRIGSLVFHATPKSSLFASRLFFYNIFLDPKNNNRS